jgi:hypothetical protein
MNPESITTVLFFALTTYVAWRAGNKWSETKPLGKAVWLFVFAWYLYIVYFFADHISKR